MDAQVPDRTRGQNEWRNKDKKRENKGLLREQKSQTGEHPWEAFSHVNLNDSKGVSFYIVII